MQNLAFMGRARSGKDTAAAFLVQKHAYTRLAFADPLKAMALSVDPFIPTGYGVTVRLQSLVADVGWEYAKDRFPEVRRVLQHLGQAVRDADPDFWVDRLMRKVHAAAGWHLPIVVTDVRYPNEADALRAEGFMLVRIVRPGAGTRAHYSEEALSDYPADALISNNAGLDSLYAQTEALALR